MNCDARRQERAGGGDFARIGPRNELFYRVLSWAPTSDGRTLVGYYATLQLASRSKVDESATMVPRRNSFSDAATHRRLWWAPCADSPPSKVRPIACVPTNRNHSSVRQPRSSEGENVTPLFRKLNLKDQAEVLVLNAPASFETELSALSGVEIVRDADDIEQVAFVLAFVMTQLEVNEVATTVAKKVLGDGVVWFAYPKASSQRYRCDFNRDTGWQVIGDLGFEGVRQVAIDDDWSALRFRRVEFVRTMSRDTTRAMTPQGKARVSDKQET